MADNGGNIRIPESHIPGTTIPGIIIPGTIIVGTGITGAAIVGISVMETAAIRFHRCARHSSVMFQFLMECMLLPEVHLPKPGGSRIPEV
jgi:hypothetical protein